MPEASKTLVPAMILRSNGDDIVGVTAMLVDTMCALWTPHLAPKPGSGDHLIDQQRYLVLTTQVEAEVHGELLKRGDLLEPEATNQGAWLTESAGALSDLHASVLESLTGFKHDYPESQRVSPAAVTSFEQQDKIKTSRRWPEALDSMGGSSRQQGDNGCSTTEGDGYNATDGTCAVNRLKAGGGGAVSGRRTETEPSCSVEEDRDRTRLRELGRLLAQKRQFTASRQVKLCS